jgi:hypothetical protein
VSDASRILNRAVAHGEIIRQPCEICGSSEMIEAHHEDYSKPLDVVWLCKRHHLAVHGKTLHKQIACDKPPRPCTLCGRPARQEPRGRPREYHENCKPIADAMTRLERLLSEFSPPWAHDTDHLLLFRRRLQMLINSLPTASRQPRDEKGRWICSTS